MPNDEAKAANNQFIDVKTFRDEILYLADKEVVYGYDHGLYFKPNDPIKRVHAVYMLLRELGITPSNPKDPGFSDVRPGSPGYEEIATAANLGIINGLPDGRFNPNGTLTRGQMAKIVTDAYHLKGTYHTNFKDVSTSHRFHSYIQALVAHNITAGYPDESFRPSANITRGQFSAFLARHLNDEFKPVDFTGAPTLSLEDVIQKEQSVVMVEVYDAEGEVISQGSGFIVANDLIATNLHVVQGGTRAVAITPDDQEIDIKGVYAFDEYADLAILKPEKQTGLPRLQISPFELVKKGQKVVTIGSPLGLQNTVTDGIVSGLHDFGEDDEELNVLQITAPITFGSSGGPLFNMKGYVIGVNSFGIEDTNFAVSADYVYGMVSDVFGIPFKDIPADDLSVLPALPEEEEPTPEEEPDWTDDVIEEEIFKNAVELPLDGERFYFDDSIYEAVQHPTEPIIFAINDDGKVVRINYATKQIDRLDLGYPADKMVYSKGELLVTLIKQEPHSNRPENFQKGGVAIIDTATFTKKNVFDVSIDPYSIAADDQYFYVSSASNQWTYVMSFDRATGVKKSQSSIRQQSMLQMHASQNKIYAITSDSTPIDMSVYTIEDGVFTSTYDSPYHGEYELEEWIHTSPDGKYLFNTIGAVFKTTSLRETNMQFVTNLETDFYGLAFNGNRFYTSWGNYITSYDLNTFAPIEHYKTSAEVFHLFYQNDQLVVVGEAKPTGSNIYKSYIQLAGKGI